MYYWDADDPGNLSTGKSIFFAIGRAGFGHRKNGHKTTWGTVTEIKLDVGVLRYNSNGYEDRSSTFKDSAPLFAAGYYRPGAIYYAKSPANPNQYLDWTGNAASDGKAMGMDMNYFSFDVNMIGDANLESGGDACFLRFVE